MSSLQLEIKCPEKYTCIITGQTMRDPGILRSTGTLSGVNTA
jgi:hypothetical protein